MGRYDNADTKDCCWWGRGILQTTGQCNYGRFNARWGAGNKNNLYSDIDFCQNPDKICTGPSELKWIGGLDHWQTEVQGYNNQSGYPDYNYQQRLKQWVDNGMDIDDTSFIDEVSGIVNRGCPELTCETDPVRKVEERREGFEVALKALGLK